MKTVELFSGCGGLTWGLMQAGMECVGFVEMDKYAHKAFKLLHDPDERMWSRLDITTVTDDDIRLFGRERGPIQVITGGFPCQSFSVAGKREGFKDRTRGTLFFEIVRFASILRPKYLVLENVAGLLSHDSGRTFGTILLALDELGYDAEWQVLNSKNYGVPQNRERVFIVCHSRASSGRKIFPISGENSQASRVIAVDNTHPSGHGMNGDVYDSNGLAPTITTNKGEGPKVAIPCLTPDRENRRQQGRRFKEPGDPMFTLTAQDKHGIAIPDDRIGGWVEREDKVFAYQNDKKRSTVQEHVYIKPEGRTDALTVGHMPKMIDQQYRIRKLTPLECFRLQSWPDEWFYKLHEAGISNSQLYRMAGNGVTSSVAFEIGKRLMEVGTRCTLK